MSLTPNNPRSDKRSRSGDSIESKAMREARQSELREMSALINELKSFDCIVSTNDAQII